jgi:hypothetical protein
VTLLPFGVATEGVDEAVAAGVVGVDELIHGEVGYECWVSAVTVRASIERASRGL